MKLIPFLIFFFYSPVIFCEKLILSIGEKTLLPLPADNVVRIGDKSLVSIDKEQDFFSVLAKKEGQTYLITGNTQHDLFVFSKTKKDQALKLDALLKTFWDLHWSLSEENIFQISGTLNRFYDWMELSQLSERYNISYHFKAFPGEGLKPLIQFYMKSHFQDRISPDILWDQLPFASIPRGEALSAYKSLLRPFGLIPKEDPLWFAEKNFVELEIALVESLSSSGFSFGGASDTTIFQLSFSSLLSFVNFLKNSGRGETLHHSKIIGQSGQKIQFHSGGHIPFNSYNMKTEQKNVHWKAYGLQLDFLPKVDKKDQIEIEIEAQISEPLSYASLDNPPPLKTQSLRNKILLKNKQIVQLFQLKKSSKGSQSYGQLSFFPSFPNSLFNGKNTYEIMQFIFLQAKIKSIN